MTLQDRIRGSLIGGAAGDALGYTVEFMGERAIFREYEGGIQAYEPSPLTGLAVISDDTQMTLFTAYAMLIKADRQLNRGIAAAPRCYANLTYQDWLLTQELRYKEAAAKYDFSRPDDTDGVVSAPLMKLPALYARRAPGLTCLSALEKRRRQRIGNAEVNSFIADKVNNSKGCGGVMRVAPVGMLPFYDSAEKVAIEGAECAAITHSHSLGYLPGAVLAEIIYRILFGDPSASLRDIVEQARDTTARIFADDEHIDALTGIINEAIALSDNNERDLVNIHQFGEGWVGEEALAIALYCCLKYPDDFSQALIVSVNHKGDSDSTGAIAGNILGAWIGYEAMEAKWKEKLELSDEILEIADLLCEKANELRGSKE